ncbi:MAG: hypothetical protein JST88_10020 [Bacteroidetes bacterium]|nr:hypothetical protein [Bacteroidota bacterium]
MKPLLYFALLFLGFQAQAQANKEPISLNNDATVWNQPQIEQSDYSNQGREMWVNNSSFYNNNNTDQNYMPAGNAHYDQPGNSNPINHAMYSSPNFPQEAKQIGYTLVIDLRNPDPAYVSNSYQH